MARISAGERNVNSTLSTEEETGCDMFITPSSPGGYEILHPKTAGSARLSEGRPRSYDSRSGDTCGVVLVWPQIRRSKLSSEVPNRSGGRQKRGGKNK